MKISRLILGLGLFTTAAAQDHALMRGNASVLGADLTFETRLEPSVPSMAAGFTGGTVTDPGGIHRYMAYNSLRKFFGYDLQVERIPLSNRFKVTFSPLTITPARIELENPASWTTVPLSGYPATQTVQARATIALDLFTNPATGQKIVEYVHIDEPARKEKSQLVFAGDSLYINVLHQQNISGVYTVKEDGVIPFFRCGANDVKAGGKTVDELKDALTHHLSRCFNRPQVDVQFVLPKDRHAPHDFTLRDVALRIAAPRVIVDGKPFPTGEYAPRAVSGPVVWAYLPGHGIFVLSLLPHPNLGFTKAGDIRGRTATFTVDGEGVALLCDADVVSGTAPYNLYVFHDARWLPAHESDHEKFILGSSESADRIVPLIDDTNRRRPLPFDRRIK